MLYAFIFLYSLIVVGRLLLDYLNISNLTKQSEVPHILSGFLESADLAKAKGYNKSRTILSDSALIFNKAAILVFLLSGLLNWYAGLFSGMGLVLGGLLFFGVLSIGALLMDAPFGYLDKFVVEKKYGFNNHTVLGWVADLLKSFLVSSVMSGIILLGVLLLLKFFPTYWWIISWALLFLFSIFIIYVYPIVVAPLFNKFTHMEGELAGKLISLAGKAGIRVSGVYQMDASKRSRHTNAYFTGIGNKKRIVLFDTLLSSHPEGEIITIMGHEIGHCKKNHVPKLFVLSQIISFTAFAFAAWAIREPILYQTFGVEGMPLFVGLFLIMIILEIPSFFISPISNAFSRKFEYEADGYAISLTADKASMATSLKRLVKDNLSNIYPHPLYVTFFYSHPPVLERIKEIESQD